MNPTIINIANPTEIQQQQQHQTESKTAELKQDQKQLDENSNNKNLKKGVDLPAPIVVSLNGKAFVAAEDVNSKKTGEESLDNRAVLKILDEKVFGKNEKVFGKIGDVDLEKIIGDIFGGEASEKAGDANSEKAGKESPDNKIVAAAPSGEASGKAGDVDLEKIITTAKALVEGIFGEIKDVDLKKTAATVKIFTEKTGKESLDNGVVLKIFDEKVFGKIEDVDLEKIIGDISGGEAVNSQWPVNSYVNQILESTDRTDQNMLGDGYCGFYGIMAQLEKRFGGKNLAPTSEGGKTDMHEQAQQKIAQLRKEADLEGFFLDQEKRQLDTNMLPNISSFYIRPIIVIAIDVDKIKQIDVVIPGFGASISSINPNEMPMVQFNESGGTHQQEALVQFLRDNWLNENSTFTEVITQLLLNPKTIGLIQSGMHFHGMLPNHPVYS